MAQFPCDSGRHRYTGPQSTVYLALGAGTVFNRQRFRLCPRHFASLLENCADRLVSITDEDQCIVDPPCMLCGHLPEEDSNAFFVTAYDHEGARTDFWGPVHPTCMQAVTEDWLTPPR